MGNIFRLSVIIFNILLYNFTNIKNIDIFIANALIFNIITFCLFIFFDDCENRNSKENNEANKKDIKSIIILGLKKQLTNIFNWVVFLFPIIFYFISDLNHTFSEIEIIFYMVMIVFLIINIIVLSTLIKRRYYKKYFIYIIILGFLGQIYAKFFGVSFKEIAAFLIGMILLTYISIISFVYLYNRKRKTFS